MSDRAARTPRGPARDAAGAAHAGAPDRSPRRTGVQQLAEIGIRIDPAPWLLKQELRRLDSLVIRAADRGARAGRPRADRRPRNLRARSHRARSQASRCIEVRREEVTRDSRRRIVSSPPARSPATRSPARSSGSPARTALFLRQHQPDRGCGYRGHVHRVLGFALWQIVDGTDDYLNCPFDSQQYERFLDELLSAEASRRTSRRTTRRTSRPACRSRRSRGAAATRCASVR